jgi:hypothetical protein
MRVKGRVQITTDALRTYVNVIEDAFGAEVDFAQLHKVYHAPMDNETHMRPRTHRRHTYAAALVRRATPLEAA